MTTKPTTSTRFDRAIFTRPGLRYCVAGSTLLAFPHWFFEAIGHHPPFNRHYADELGSFIRSVGVAVLASPWKPSRSQGIDLLAAAASLMHGIGHTANTSMHDADTTPWLTGPLPLLLLERRARGGPALVGTRRKP